MKSKFGKKMLSKKVRYKLSENAVTGALNLNKGFSMKKKSLLILFCVFIYVLPLSSESLDSIISYYEIANEYFERSQYDKAIENYQEFWKKYSLNQNLFKASSSKFSKDNNETIKETYFSLYNIACCYSLQKKYDKAEFFLKYAILAGYPYLNYIINDEDLQNLFNANKELVTEIKKIFNTGNITDLFIGKKIYEEGFDGICFCFFKNKDGKYCFTKYSNTSLDAAKHEIYGEGEFEFKNYKLFLKYDVNKEIYRYYENNLRTEKDLNKKTETINWYKIGTDMSVSDYYIKEDWNGFYKELNNEILIPIL